MDEDFDEHSSKARDIMEDFEDLIIGLGMKYGIHYEHCAHDIARQFLNEIEEFSPEEEKG